MLHLKQFFSCSGLIIDITISGNGVEIMSVVDLVPNDSTERFGHSAHFTLSSGTMWKDDRYIVEFIFFTIMKIRQLFCEINL